MNLHNYFTKKFIVIIIFYLICTTLYSQNNISDSSNISFGYLRGYEIRNKEVYHWGGGSVMTGAHAVKQQPSKFDFNGAKSIVCGYKNNFIIDTNGQLYSWGYNNYGEAGIGVKTEQPNPVKVASNKKWLCVLSNYGSINPNFGESILAIKEDSSLWGWGENKKKQIRYDLSDQNILTPIKIDSINKFTSIGFDRNYAYALRKDGTLWSWGNYSSSNMIKIASNIKSIYGNSNAVYFIDSLGKLYANRDLTTLNYLLFDNTIKWKKVSTGWDHALGISESGDVYSWGNNNRGQLGIGINNIQIIVASTPQKITNTNNYSDLATYESTSMIRNSDGTVWSFGANGNFMLGFCNGSSPSGTLDNIYYSPTLVNTINTIPTPILRDTSYCNNANSDTLKFNASTGANLIWYGTNASGGTGSNVPIKPNTTTIGTIYYYASQLFTSTGCESSRSKITVTIKPIPAPPTLTRSSDNYLNASSSGTTWYKDGSAITDTAQKYKPTTAGSYTAKTTTNGCTSVMSSAYYYLVTDIINLSKDEFIKLAPNPFINQLNFDFIVKGYQKLNIEVYDVATGSKVATQQNITAGTKIQLGQLARGTYIVRVTSNDNKIAQQFKIVKL